MCAIIGWSGDLSEGLWGSQVDLFEAMLLAAESHGPHATGFVAHSSAYKKPYRESIITAKAPLPASEFIRTNSRWRSLRHKRSATVLGHVRYATHGSPEENRNNHPFVSDDGRFHLVHNGVLSNHEDVVQHHQLALQSECDSEAILRLIEATGEPIKGLSTVLGEFEGSMAVALFDAQTGLIWLATNGGRPLLLCKLKGRFGWLWASTRTILHRALARVYGENFARLIEVEMPLSPYVLHAISPIGRVLTVDADGAVERRTSLVDD